MVYFKQFISDVITEVSYRTKEGTINFENPDHISILSEVLDEMGLSDIKNELFNNLFEEEKRFSNSVLNRKVRYRDEDGEEKEGIVGNLLRKGEDFPGREAAEKVVPKEGTPQRDKLNAELGSEKGGKTTPPPKEDDKDKESEDTKEKESNEQPSGASVNIFGDEYKEDLPDEDPASEKVEEGILLEAAFSPSELAKTKYQPKWIDHIKNGKPFQLEPYGEIIIDKSFLKSNGYGDKSLEQVLSGGGKDDIENFFKDGRSFGTIIPSKDGKKYKLTDISKSTFTGQGGGDIPKDAAYYEMGICVEYNKSKGMNTPDAMKAASVDPKKYQRYEAHLTDVCSKVAKNLPNVGSALRQTGGDSYSPASQWPSSDGTPKTDIYGGSSHRISVKKSGGSQLASGKGGDARGLFLGGLAFYETHSSATATKYLQNVVKQIETDFKSFNTDNEVGKIREKATTSYIQWRVPQISKQTNAKAGDIEKHAKAEAIAVGITGARGNWQSWFLEDVNVLGEREVMAWFDGYWKSQGTKDLQEEARNIVNAAIDHKRLDSELKKAFNDNEFKKWVVYEASSGNFKFSGNPDLNSVNDAIANEILVFDLNGGVKVKTISDKWAASYASNVTPNVNFKSSGRQKYTALRLMQESKDFGITDFQNDLVDIMNEEMESLNGLITESVEVFNELINEINFKQIISKIKKVAKRLMNRILDSIKRFYNNVIKKVINKIKEYIKLGINKFLDYIGVDIDGKVSLSINF
jgi:hypothetical protein